MVKKIFRFLFYNEKDFEKERIKKIMYELEKHPNKDKIINKLCFDLDIKETHFINRDKLLNLKNWFIENEIEESLEFDGYKRKPQRHYRHKIYKDFFINESYLIYPREKKRVFEIFKEKYENGYFNDETFLYISATEK